MLLYNPFKYDKCIRVDGGFCRGALCQPPKLFRRRASVKVVKCVIPPVEVLNAKIDFRAYVHHIDSRAACCNLPSNAPSVATITLTPTTSPPLIQGTSPTLAIATNTLTPAAPP